MNELITELLNLAKLENEAKSEIYDVEDLSKEGKTESRVVLRLHPQLAPYKVAVLPLRKNNHSEKANEVFDRLSPYFACTYDETEHVFIDNASNEKFAYFASSYYPYTNTDGTITLNTIRANDNTAKSVTVKWDSSLGRWLRVRV